MSIARKGLRVMDETIVHCAKAVNLSMIKAAQAHQTRDTKAAMGLLRDAERTIKYAMQIIAKAETEAQRE